MDSHAASVRFAMHSMPYAEVKRFIVVRAGLPRCEDGQRRDERDAAIEHLNLAIAEFREMKTKPSLERVTRQEGY